MTTKITADNITDSAITSAKILDGTIVKSDLGAIANAAVQWQSVVVADGSTGLNLELISFLPAKSIMSEILYLLHSPQ